MHEDTTKARRHQGVGGLRWACSLVTWRLGGEKFLAPLREIIPEVLAPSRQGAKQSGSNLPRTSRSSWTTISTTPAPFTLESPNAAHPSCPAAPNARRTLAPARNLAPKKLAFVGRCAKMRAWFFSVNLRSKSGAPRWARPSNFLYRLRFPLRGFRGLGAGRWAASGWLTLPRNLLLNLVQALSIEK